MNKIAKSSVILAALAQAKSTVVEKETSILNKDGVRNEKGILLDAGLIMEGIIIGAIEAEFTDDLSTCIQDGESIIANVEDSVWSFEAGHVEGYVQGLKSLGAACFDAYETIKDCKAVVTDVTKLATMGAMYSNPGTAVLHIGYDIVIHGVSIWHEIQNAIADMKKDPKDYKDFGINIGRAAAQIIIGQETPIALEHNKRQKIALVLAGMTEMYGANFNLENLLFCIYQEDQALLMLDASVQSLESAWQKKDMGDAVGGLIGLVGFVQQFQQGLPTCEAIVTTGWEYQEFVNSIDIAAHPMKHIELLENDIKMHGVSILDDIHNAVDAYKSEQYESFGKIMGKVMKLATDNTETVKAIAADITPAQKREMMAEIYQGFFEGTGVGTFNFTDLLLCIYQADQSAIELYEGVQLLESAWQKKDWQNALGGAFVVFTAAESFVQNALPVCEQIASDNHDFTKFNQIKTVAQDKDHKMKIIGDNITFNDVTITGDFIQAMEAFEAGDLRKFGFKLGQALEFATYTDSKMFIY